jgi:enamine deaminase RidA (YjgF/YER057c/UK114 family)
MLTIVPLQKQIMNNLKAVLEAAGTNLNNVVKFNIYLTDMANFAAVNEVYVTFLADKKPVSLTLHAAK